VRRRHGPDGLCALAERDGARHVIAVAGCLGRGSRGDGWGQVDTGSRRVGLARRGHRSAREEKEDGDGNNLDAQGARRDDVEVCGHGSERILLPLPPPRRLESPIHEPHWPKRYAFGRAIMVPAPLAYPLASFAAARAEHARLLGLARDALVFAYGKVFNNSLCPAMLTGIVRRKDDGEVANGLFPREDALGQTRGLHGVCRELFAIPDEEDTLPVVVMTSDAVSLQRMRIEARAGGKPPRLVVAQRDVAFEPAPQTQWRTGAWTVIRWLEPGEGSEHRYAWVATPPEPQSEGEVIERTVAFYDEKVSRQIRQWLRRAIPAHEMVGLVGSTQCCGDWVLCSARRSIAEEMAAYPTIRRAMAEGRKGHVPVLVTTEMYGGLCWLSVGAGETGRIDPHPTIVAEAFGLVDPGETARFAREDLEDEWPAYQTGIEGTVDRLVRLSAAELDAEIFRAGFDPATERRGGPGLRESVVAAIGR
jgi:hypothetical protein